MPLYELPVPRERIVTDANTLEIRGPSKGLFTALPGLFTDQRYSPAVDNVRFFRGEFVKRPGTAHFPIDPNDITAPVFTSNGIPIGAHTYERAAGNMQTLMATDDKWYYYNGTTWADITDATAFTGTPSDPWVFATALDLVCGSNGVDNIRYWDGAAGTITRINPAVTGEAPTAARHMMGFAGRLIVGHTIEAASTLADRVRWCAAANITVWDPATNNTAGFNDTVDWPGPVTGMVVLGGRGYIFKRNAIIVMEETGYVEPAFRFARVVDGIGTIEGRTIAQHGGLTYFLGEDNVYAWDGASLPRPIGTPIRNELFTVLNRNRFRQCFGFVHPTFNEYWLCVPMTNQSDPTSPDAWAQRAYIYNYLEDAWGRADRPYTCAASGKQVGSSQIIDDMSFLIDSWVTPIDAGFGGDEEIFPIIGQYDTLTTGAETGQMLRISDTIVDDTGTFPTASFETVDARFYPEGARPRDATIDRVTLTNRCRGDATFEVLLSGDGGRTWVPLGSRSTTTTATDAIEYIHFDARFTAPQCRVRVISDDPFAFVGVSFDYHMGTELR